MRLVTNSHYCQEETGSNSAGNSVMAASASGDEIEDDEYEALAYQQVIIPLIRCL